MSSAASVRDAQAAAAGWDARLRSPDCSAAERQSFRDWYDKNQCHREAFDRLQIALTGLRHAVDHPQLRALRDQARETVHRAGRLRRWRRTAAAAASVAVLGFFATFVVREGLQRRPIQTEAVLPRATVAADARVSSFATGRGERRTVILPDGSSMTLNTGTRVEEEWLPSERRVRLIEGQALFRVAKNPSRPFIVTAGERTVTALGTAFDVRLQGDQVQVTLLEGRVAVRGVGTAAPQPALELKPNEQLVSAHGALLTVRSVDVAVATSWAEGQVFFTDETLSAAVGQMNQYSTTQIVLADPQLAEYRINGMFRAGNQDGFVGALTSYYPIESRRDESGRIVLSRRHSASAAR